MANNMKNRIIALLLTIVAVLCCACSSEETAAPVEPVTDEETAIFTAAVGDYPMLKANPVEVASRTVPKGVEYLFTALDIPREPGPESSFRQIKVYVLAETGKEPVFTRVVR